MNQITITFLSGLISGDTIEFSYYGLYPSNITPFVRNENVVNTRVNPGETSTGATANAQATNYYNAFVADYGSQFTESISGNVVTIIPNNNSPLFSPYSNSSNVIFNISSIGIITNVDGTNGCVYFTLSPSYSGETGVAIETSTDNGVTWSYSVGSVTSPRCSSVAVTVPTLYRLRGINTFSGQTSNIYSFTPTVNVTIEDDIRARSPYLLISTGTTANTFTTTVFNITQFEGDKDTYLTQPLSYVKTKNKVVNSQDNIWISLSNMVKEKLEGSIDNFVISNYTVAQDLATNESKWVVVETLNQYLDTTVSSATTGYFVVDGYIEPLESQGLPNLLMTGDKRYVNRSTTDRVFFKTLNLTAATYITSSVSTPVTISYAAASATTFNNKYVQSVKVNKLNTDDEWIKYNFSYSSGATQSVTFYLYDECKFEVYNLVFKNKYGMLESFPMSKKSSKAMTVTGNDYLRSIVNYNGEFNINRHTAKQFNVAGTEQWTLNTDYLPEYMNAPIKEAMLTEEMWLIDSEGVILPVVKLDQEISFKTSLNDKLIQYTLKIKLSHETVNNIL